MGKKAFCVPKRWIRGLKKRKSFSNNLVINCASEMLYDFVTEMMNFS